MSINSALSNAGSGLHAAARRAELTAHNIANASTEGYARQSVESVQNLTAGQGAGVRLADVERAVSPVLTNSRREADAGSGMDSERATAGRNIADTLARADEAGSIFARVAALETSLRALAETPEQAATQDGTLRAAQSVASTLNSAAADLNEVRTDADAAIDSAVNTVNGALEQVSQINTDIKYAISEGRDTASLENERAVAIDKITDYLGIQVLDRQNSEVAIYTDEGVALLEGSVRPLEFRTVPIVGPGAEYVAPSGTGALSGITVEGQEITPGTGVHAIDTGKLTGLFEARDSLGTDAIAELDALAAGLIERFESGGLASVSGAGLFTDGGAALSATPAAGLAGRIEVNAAVDPEQGGAVWRLRDGLDATTPGPIGNTTYATALLDAMTELRAPPAGSSLISASSAKGMAAGVATLTESRAISLEDQATTSESRRASLQSAESNATGVSLDVELQNLVRIEQAYAANARVLEVADRMIQRLLEI